MNLTLESKIKQARDEIVAMAAKNDKHLSLTVSKFGAFHPTTIETTKQHRIKETTFKLLSDTISMLVDTTIELEENVSQIKAEAFTQGERIGYRNASTQFLGSGNSTNKAERELARVTSITNARNKWPELY